MIKEAIILYPLDKKGEKNNRKIIEKAKLYIGEKGKKRIDKRNEITPKQTSLYVKISFIQFYSLERIYNKKM